VWEQKTNDGSVHDKDNAYTWNTAMGGTTPNGTAFTVFLGTLNDGTSSFGMPTGGCFAGHCDWRLPAVEELESIVDSAAPGCSTFASPCIDQTVFGPTVAFASWSATTYSADPAFAWHVSFFDGFVAPQSKSGGVYVRRLCPSGAVGLVMRTRRITSANGTPSCWLQVRCETLLNRPRAVPGVAGPGGGELA